MYHGETPENRGVRSLLLMNTGNTGLDNAEEPQSFDLLCHLGVSKNQGRQSRPQTVNAYSKDTQNRDPQFMETAISSGPNRTIFLFQNSWAGVSLKACCATESPS